MTAIATPIVAISAAVIAGLIAYRNWKTAQNKLRLDLFKERLDVYRALTSSLDKIAEFKWDKSEFTPFFNAYIESRFMFDQAYSEWAVDELFFAVYNYNEDFKNAAKVGALFSKVIDVQIELRKRLEPFLTLRE